MGKILIHPSQASAVDRSFHTLTHLSRWAATRQGGGLVSELDAFKALHECSTLGVTVQSQCGAAWGGWYKASVLGCSPLAAPIGLSPPLILTLYGSKRVLVVSMEPLDDDLSCFGGGGSPWRAGERSGGKIDSPAHAQVSIQTQTCPPPVCRDQHLLIVGHPRPPAVGVWT